MVDADGKSKWNAAPINYKCDRGLHTVEFYKKLAVPHSQCLDGNMDVMAVDLDMDEDSYTSYTSSTSKRLALCELSSSSPKRRQVDYVEKGSAEFKGKAH